MKWHTSILLSLLMFLALSPLSSLTEEEKEALPDLSKSDLIKIILLYDQQMIDSQNNFGEIEKALNEREKILDEDRKQIQEQERLLIVKEESLNEREMILKLQSQLYQESLQIQSEMRRAQTRLFFEGLAVGIVGGFVVNQVMPE